MKYLFAMTMYKRPQISELCLLGLERLRKIHDFEILVCGSTDEDREVCKGVNYIHHENLPLGKKNNYLFQTALEGNFDYLVNLGSDNLASDKLWEHYLTLREDYVKPKGIYFLDSETQRAVKVAPQNTLGAFRMFSRELLENVGKTYAVTFRQDVNQFKQGHTYEIKKRLYEYLNKVGVIALQYETFNLWAEDINNGLDFSSESRIIENGYTAHVVDFGKPQVIDVKSDGNIWKYEKFTDNPQASKREVFSLIGEKEIKHLNKIINL